MGVILDFRRFELQACSYAPVDPVNVFENEPREPPNRHPVEWLLTRHGRTLRSAHDVLDGAYFGWRLSDRRFRRFVSHAAFREIQVAKGETV